MAEFSLIFWQIREFSVGDVGFLIGKMLDDNIAKLNMTCKDPPHQWVGIGMDLNKLLDITSLVLLQYKCTTMVFRD